jgi:hypothetical protein
VFRRAAKPRNSARSASVSSISACRRSAMAALHAPWSYGRIWVMAE